MAPARRWALGVSYLGRGWSGWQRQGHADSVQQRIEEVLAQVAGSEARLPLTASGRTDAGVHALQQIAHFDSAAERTPAQWVAGANALLPDSVRVLWVRDVLSHKGRPFHARHWTLARSYVYLLDSGAVRSPLWKDRSGYSAVPLDAEAMRLALRPLLGAQDFSAFRAGNCRARSPVRRLLRAEVIAVGRMLALHLVANGFLQNMVRILAGALVEVGKGRRDPSWLRELLLRGERGLAGRTAPGRGLHFLGPSYPDRCDLPPPPPPQACWSGAAWTAQGGKCTA